MQLWRKETHKHSQEEWATNFRTYYFQNICWCELLANNTKKKKRLIFYNAYVFLWPANPSPQSVANLFD
jgi:hypothetical protein